MPAYERFHHGRLSLQVLSESSPKDERASSATDPNGPVPLALRKLAELFPSLLLITDVCLCPYASHGHCGIFSDEECTAFDNSASITRLAEISVYVISSANVVSDPFPELCTRVRADSTPSAALIWLLHRI